MPKAQLADKTQVRELAALKQAEVDLLRQLALDSTWVMATMVLWPDLARKHYFEPIHRPMLDWWDAVATGGRAALKCHRQFRKTMLFDVAYDVRMICKDPNIRIMLMSSYQRTAHDICALVKRQFTHNESFKRIFPEMAINDTIFGKVDEFTHPKRSLTSLLDPTFFATYLGAPLISKRADIILYDDPVDESMVNNPDLAAKTMDAFNQTIPLLDSTSDHRKRLFIGTPKSYNDPLSALTGEFTGDTDVQVADTARDWAVKSIPLLINPAGEPDINGEPPLANIFTRQSVLDILEECKRDTKRGESYFWREYMLKVQAPGDAKFKLEWFNNWLPRIPAATAWKGIAIDSATKDEQILMRGDYTVGLVAAFDTYGNLYLVDGMRSNKLKFNEMMQQVTALAQRHQAFSIVREKVGEGGMFGAIREWFNNHKLPVSIYPVTVRGQGKKYVRIVEALQGPLQARKIYFVDGFPKELHQAIVDEALHLGQWSHDDAIDAMSLFFHKDVRVVPQPRGTTQWKDPVERVRQVSTVWTNPAALGHSTVRDDKPSDRLTPFGETTILTGEGMFDQRPSAQPLEEALPWWEKP